MQRRTIEVHGAMVLWNIAAESDLNRSRAAFADCGLEDFTPQQRSDSECLRAALDECKRKGQIIQRLKNPKKNGMEVVTVDRAEVHNEYTSDYNAKVVEGRVVTGYGWADNERIQEQFDHAKRILTPSGISGPLVRVIKERLHGLTYGRSTGGVYWIEADAVPVLEDLAPLIEDAAVNGETTISVNEIGLTPRTARDLLNSLTEQVRAEAERILTEVRKGLGVEALNAREKQAVELDGLIQHYEPILSDSLTSLHSIAETCRQVVSMTAMQQMAAAMA